MSRPLQLGRWQSPEALAELRGVLLAEHESRMPRERARAVSADLRAGNWGPMPDESEERDQEQGEEEHPLKSPEACVRRTTKTSKSRTGLRSRA